MDPGPQQYIPKLEKISVMDDLVRDYNTVRDELRDLHKAITGMDVSRGGN